MAFSASKSEIDLHPLCSALIVRFEAKGDAKKAYENINAAATEFRAEHYMGDVARVHFKRLLAANA